MNNNSKNQVKVVATIGPASSTPEIFFAMVEKGLDIVRFNFAWGDNETRIKFITMIRTAEEKFGKKIPMMADLPGPRIQLEDSHTYDAHAGGALETEDKKHIAFAIEHKYEYIAASFVGTASDVETYRAAIRELGGNQKLIAKIERKIAIENADEIILAADGIMIARGDMGNEIPLEKIPFVQESLIQKTNKAGKPVITATQMLLSMTQSPVPERAEVSDISHAVTDGTSAVMLSEESASGKYPVQAVEMMKKIVTEAQSHPTRLPTVFMEEGDKKNQPASGKLFLVRHQESEWNEKGLWTGSRDVHLTQEGFKESEEMGILMKDLTYDYAFASMQVRSIETLTCILDKDCQYDIPTEHVSALNERSYGDYTGKNKWDVEKEVGEETFEKIRREWDYPVPHGETLKMVYERSVPFFLEKVLPLLLKGKNVLIVSHGNTIRSLMKYIEEIPDNKISQVEMLFSSVLIYDLNEQGHMVHKEIRSLPKN